MPVAHEIVIDPFLLCLPHPCHTSEQLELFIDSLLGWKNLLGHRDSNVLFSDSAQIALNKDDEFPHRHRLADLLKVHQCDIADEKTISKLVYGILEKVPSFEDYCGIDVILIDEAQVKVEPKIMLTRLKDNCSRTFAEILTMVSLIRTLDPQNSHDTLVVASTLASENTQPLPDHIDVKSEVHELDFLQDGMNIPEEFPHTIVDKIPVSFSHEKLLSQLGLWAVWDNASDEETAKSAINMKVEKLLDSGVSADEKNAFILGSHFIDSVKTWGFGSRSDYAMILIESCARIILGIPKKPLNEFRENSKPTSGQRVRNDGALAFRTHLTKKGVGFRLMIWKMPNGIYEFANVGSKNELEIL